MDEPFTGLDPVNLILLREAFVELRDRGRTVIFSTHQMEAAEAMCESVAIVDRGRLVAGGRVRDLKRASGRRTVRLGVAGETVAVRGSPGCPAWSRCGRAPASPNSSSCRASMPASILAAVLADGALVTRFELVEPSLETIFIEHVGRPADDDPTLGRRRRRPTRARGDGRRLMADATRSSRTRASSPAANTATVSAARCSSPRRSCSWAWP